jgi:hypothetical protein
LILCGDSVKCKTDFIDMATDEPTPLRWITIRLGEDFNWWLQDTSAELSTDTRNRGVLDPRQVSHIIEALDEYRPFGFRAQLLTGAFQLFTLESEISEGVLRLAAEDADLYQDRAQLFALPLITDEGQGAYYDLLDAISAARIRKINATHRFARECTEDEMQEELNALDSDRYFASESIHAFDEINEILEWSPAEWDDFER